MFVKNNNVYSDRITREGAERKQAKEERSSNRGRNRDEGCFATLKGFSDDALFATKLHVKYTLAPILKVLPSVLFRVFAYCLIVSYSSDFYTGMGYFLPLILVTVIVLLEFLAGKMIKLRNEEAMVNAFCGVTLPIYLDVFTVVSSKAFVNASLLLLKFYNTNFNLTVI